MIDVRSISSFGGEFWQEIFQTLATNKLRAFLTSCGIFWGVFILVGMLGIATGLERGVQMNLRGTRARSVFVWPQRTSLPHRGLKPGRYVKLRNDDIEAIQRTAGVAHVAPRLRLGGWRDGQSVTGASKTGTFNVFGDYPALPAIEPFRLVRGRFLNERDLLESRKVAAIGDEARTVLFGHESPLGKYITVKGVHFLIVGELASDGAGDDAERVSSSVFVPFSTFQLAFNHPNRVGWFSFSVQPWASADATEASVKAMLRARHGVHPDDPDAFASFNVAKEADRIDQLFGSIRGFVWFVGVLTLFAGVMGVSNILLVTVKERTREIGTRRALGATSWSILSTILGEAFVLTAISGYAGLVSSVAGLEVLRKALEHVEKAPLYQPEVDIRVAFTATLLLSVAGLLAGLIPARHATKLAPAEALRAE